jgi:uncharacterized membrane protein YdjX (TVP38/TMEM64 family)
MRGILIVFVTISAILGAVLMFLAVRDGGFQQAGRVVDRQVNDAGADARRAVEQAGDAIERTTDRAARDAN